MPRMQHWQSDHTHIPQSWQHLFVRGGQHLFVRGGQHLFDLDVLFIHRLQRILVQSAFTVVTGYPTLPRRATGRPIQTLSTESPSAARRYISARGTIRRPCKQSGEQGGGFPVFAIPSATAEPEPPAQAQSHQRPAESRVIDMLMLERQRCEKQTKLPIPDAPRHGGDCD